MVCARADTMILDEHCIFPVWFVLLLGRSVLMDKAPYFLTSHPKEQTSGTHLTSKAQKIKV